MGKVKVKKSDVWIDMTPMSDVMTLLLTFFMLTSTFIKNEPVRVITPGTVSEKKVPETNTFTITIGRQMDAAGKNPTGNGQVFFGMDNAEQLGQMLDAMVDGMDSKAHYEFESMAQFGCPISDIKTYLATNSEKRSKDMVKSTGIPLDSIDGGMSEFQQWVTAALNANPDLNIVIKADANSPYKTVKKVMSELQDMGESHYYLATQLDGQKVVSANNYVVGGSE